jgi:calcineurin-like phosphoesterase family protein
MRLKLDPKKTFFTSDIHLFHNNIIKYDNRPFDNVEQMHEAFVLNWNSVVPKDGTTIILGDLAMGGSEKAEQVYEILKELNGEIYLVPGNHDNYIFKHKGIMERIVVLPQLYEFYLDNQYIVMCHYPLYSWNKMGHNSWMLHGHQHGRGNLKTGKILDIGISSPGYDFSPLSYEKVKGIMDEKVFVSVDHHNNETRYHD